ncbi:MAG: hypothetical protein JW798_06980 [Prolixibacteraceae bacterium]|nr:hypothetical protein [Prolixibacteraceae bacterium]
MKKVRFIPFLFAVLILITPVLLSAQSAQTAQPASDCEIIKKIITGIGNGLNGLYDVSTKFVDLKGDTRYELYSIPKGFTSGTVYYTSSGEIKQVIFFGLELKDKDEVEKYYFGLEDCIYPIGFKFEKEDSYTDEYGGSDDVYFYYTSSKCKIQFEQIWYWDEDSCTILIRFEPN